MEKTEGVSKTQKEKMEIWQGIMKRWAETLSDGIWSLDFMHLDVKPFSRESGYYSPHSTHSVDQNEKMYLLIDEYDTYAITSPTVSPGLGDLVLIPLYLKFFMVPNEDGSRLILNIIILTCGSMSFSML